MKNKKTVIAIITVFLAIIFTFAACKKNSDSVAYVTDENGVTLVDANGEPITVVPETSVVTITDGNGNVVTNAEGEAETSIYYKPQQVVVPVTNENHEAVTGSNGEVLTTLVWFPAVPTTTSVETVTVTDSNGDVVTDPSGNPVTETTIVSAANESFSKTMGGSGNDKAVAVVPASDGGTFAAVAGNSKDGLFASISGTRSQGFAICKYGSDGTLQWTKAFGSRSNVSVQDIAPSKDGGVLVVGQTRSEDFMTITGSEYDAFLIKLDKDGNELFRKPWGGSSNEDFYGVAEGADGSIYAVGFSYSSDGSAASLGIKEGDARSVIVKFSPQGEVVKATGLCGFGDYFADIAIAKNGDIFVVGSLNNNSTQTAFEKKGGADAGVFKFNSDLVLQFGKSFGGSGRERFSSIAVTDDGGFIIAGASTSSDGDIGAAGIKNKGQEDAVIAKFSASGSIVFVKAFFGSNNDSFNAVTVTAQGYIIAAGESESKTRNFQTIGNKGGKDIFLVRFDSNGDLQSAIGFGGTGDDAALAVCTTTGGQIVTVGATTSNDFDFSNLQPASDGKNAIAFIKTITF